MPLKELFPTGDDNTQFTPVGEATRYECVDDPTTDEDTTYVQRQNSQASQFLDHETFAEDAGSINSVKVKVRARHLTGDATQIRCQIRINGTDYLGSYQNLTDSYADYQTTWTQNPDTTAAWTVDDVKGTGSNPLSMIFSFRAGSVTTGEEVRVTRAVVEIDYEPSSVDGVIENKFTRPGPPGIALER